MGRIYRNPEAERRIQQRLFVTIAAKHEIRIRREVGKQYLAAAEAYAKGRSTDKAVIGAEGKVKDSIVGVMTASFVEIGNRTGKAISEASGKSWKRTNPMDPAFRAALNAYLEKYSGKKVTQVSKATRDEIALWVKRGVSDGMTTAEISNEIRKNGKIHSAYRAHLIARTESHSAANAGSFGQAVESDVVKEKEWIATLDSRTRDGSDGSFDHTNVKNAAVDKAFNVSGEELMFPGDPSGSAGNIIMCRCAMGYVV